MRRVLRQLSITLVVGLILLVISGLMTNQPNAEGFPFSYAVWIAGCAAPGFACRGYDPLLVGVDYLFWMLVAFASIFSIDSVSVQINKLRRKG